MGKYMGRNIRIHSLGHLTFNLSYLMQLQQLQNQVFHLLEAELISEHSDLVVYCYFHWQEILCGRIKMFINILKSRGGTVHPPKNMLKGGSNMILPPTLNIWHHISEMGLKYWSWFMQTFLCKSLKLLSADREGARAFLGCFGVFRSCWNLYKTT